MDEGINELRDRPELLMSLQMNKICIVSSIMDYQLNSILSGLPDDQIRGL
jgi:hypothetical protein